MFDDIIRHGAIALPAGDAQKADGRSEDELARPVTTPRPRHDVRQPVRELLVHAFYSRRMISVAALIPLLVGIALAGASVRRYSADAMLVVLLSRDNTSSSDVTGSTPVNLSITGLKEVTSEIDIITSGAVVDEALRQVGPATLRPGIGEDSLFGLLPGVAADEQVKASEDWLRSYLRVGVQDETNVLHLTFSHPDRDIAARTLQALIDAYLSHRRQIYANTTSSYLGAELETTTKRLREVDATIAATKARSQVIDIAQDITAVGARVERIQRRRDELAQQRAGAGARITATIVLLAREPERVFASNEASNQNTNDESRNTILRMQLDRDHLAAQYAPGFPPLAELDKKLRSAREAAAVAQSTNSLASRTARNPTWDALNSSLVGAHAEAASLDRQLTQVDAELGPAMDRAKTLREADVALRTLQREHDSLEANFRQFSAREAAARINEDAAHSRDANVHVMQPPAVRWRGNSQRLSFLLAGLTGSVLVACATALLSSQLRQVFLLPVEAERALDLPVLADLPVGPEAFNTPSGMKHVANFAAMLLDLACAGERKTGSGQNGTVIQFVSPDDDGASAALIRALSVEFAVIHNITTLLIDLHAPAGAEAGAAADADGNLRIAGTAYPKLKVAAGAARSDLVSSRVLLAQSLAILTNLRAHHEIILVNATSPVGDYAARRLATLADGTILVLQADVTRQTAAAELCESLHSAGAPLVGSVMLGVRRYLPSSIQRWL